MKSRSASFARLVLALALFLPAAPAADFLTRVPLENARATITLPSPRELHFLEFGTHSYAPAPLADVESAPGVVIAPFQNLRTTVWKFSAAAFAHDTTVTLEKPATRDAFWDQLITVDPTQLGPLPRYRLIESGDFAAALPAHVRALDVTPAELARQRASLADPIISPTPAREIPWTDLERAAYPLDFQKVLLAAPHDPNPAFAFQNGQWLTTWLSRDLPKWNKEDHWFAPALLLGDDTLVRPAPLSARTTWHRTADGHTLPLWTLEWSHAGITVRQEIFSAVPSASAVHVRFTLTHAPAGTRLALGLGRRPNVHYWDDTKRERTPLPFFQLAPGYRQDGPRLVDAWGHTILHSPQPFTLEPLGPVEQLALFTPDARGIVTLSTPQLETLAPTAAKPATTAAPDFDRAHRETLAHWTAHLAEGAQVSLPSPEWRERIDAWRTQVEQITRVNYQKRERLSYGAYFYQAYFGIEEAWPVVALALWGRDDEAKRQAAIMLEPENLDKKNVHHQSRNGAAPTAATTVARLLHDRAWLESLAPVLLECAAWTERVRHENADTRSPLTRGLLPPHIYGGDVRDPATSLYATAACWRGLFDTATAFRALGTPALQREADRLFAEATALRTRLDEVISAVTAPDTTPPFLPFALELPSLAQRHEGPHSPITATRFGNYWNLFAPSFLELGLREHNATVFDYAQAHGGLWAGLPRFYAGLDAAYAIGNIARLLDRAAADLRFRPQALASLHAFMLHAASRNGHTIPEVAGLFPYRLQRTAYEQLVRESPWNFGMYDANRYLEGHISFTEPLGSGAGEALWLIRHALLTETPDGNLLLLPTIPADWLTEGKEIVLRDFPTLHGKLSATIRSHLTSRREITLDYRFAAFDPSAPSPQLVLRLTPPDAPPQHLRLTLETSGSVRAKF